MDWIETKGRAPQRKVEFPLTDYIVALMRHPDLGLAPSEDDDFLDFTRRGGHGLRWASRPRRH